METTTLATIIADVRSRTDTETPTPALDHVTDVEITRWVQQAYRELVDIIIDNGGEEALDVLAISATLTAPFTLPDDFYREVSVDANIEGFDQQLSRQAWRTRHRRSAYAVATPRYRTGSGVVQFFPSSSAPSSVVLWYIPSMSSTDLDTEVTTFNGWDEFIIACTAMKVCEKDELDDAKFVRARGAAMARVVTAASNLSTATTQTIQSVATFAEDFLD